jgi:glutathione synthase/RimK-type ligase-like ATP-grasp enzyme
MKKNIDVIILASPKDSHAALGDLMLKAEGINSLIIDYSDFPDRARLSISQTGCSENTQLELDGLTYDLSSVRSIWVRKMQRFKVRQKNGIYAMLALEELIDFLNDGFENIGSFWLPGRWTTMLAWEKRRGRMLSLAKRVGFKIPDTLITQEPRELIDFYERHNGNIIAKKYYRGIFPAYNLPGHVTNWGSFSFTKPVRPLDFKYLHQLCEMPVVFQEQIPKQLELRITVVGTQVFAAAIRSQETHRTKQDWRLYDTSNTEYFIYDLPDSIADACVNIAAEMDLTYGAIDMIETPSGDLYFLEINPAGQSLWIEERTGLPITDCICRMLINAKHTSNKRRLCDYG